LRRVSDVNFENVAKAEFDMINAKRLRHATLRTPDLDRLLAHYESVIGLSVVAREPHRVFLATESGQLALIIENASEPELASLSFDVAGDADLPDLGHKLADRGLRSDLLSDPSPSNSAALRFIDIEGREIELLVGCHFFENRIGSPGISPNKLGHVACFTGDPNAISRFYGELLGFRVSDWIEDRFVFMRCGFDHHALNFARGETVRLHHLAFELRDASHMHRACDVLGARRIPILWGPVRHGPGHNIAIYHRDPDGHVVELFYDLDRMVDEELGFFDPRPWHRDRPQRPKVWTGLPRDIWGSPPSPDLPEFYRMRSRA
jgi:catechol 2,3-dioxygenase-like lactoylglutathione lyase family enzyme